MPILVLRHEPFEHLGRFASILDARNVPFSYRDLGEPLSLQGENGEIQDGVIVMGGPMSANDSLPGLGAELALIEQAVKARIPLLGICLGAQLIAKAPGARVYRNAQEEIGWEPVRCSGASRRRPLSSTGMARLSTFPPEPIGWLIPKNAGIRRSLSRKMSMESSFTRRLLRK